MLHMQLLTRTHHKTDLRSAVLSDFKSLTACQILNLSSTEETMKTNPQVRGNVYSSQALSSHLVYFSDIPTNCHFLLLRQPRMGANSSLRFIKKK